MTRRDWWAIAYAFGLGASGAAISVVAIGWWLR